MICKKENGFTLIEILIAIAIIGIIFIAIANLNINGFKVWNYDQNIIDAQQISRIIFARIRPYIRTTTVIKTSDLPNELYIDFPTRTDSGKDYDGMTFGVKDYEFFYQKHYADDMFSNRMSITCKENIRVVDLEFNPDIDKKIIEIKLTLEKGKTDYKFVDRIFLRNTDISIISTQ